MEKRKYWIRDPLSKDKSTHVLMGVDDLFSMERNTRASDFMSDFSKIIIRPTYIWPLLSTIQYQHTS